MVKKTTFIHLSDLHLTPASKKNINGMGIDTLSKFLEIFEDIKRRELHPDFFIVSGDLIHEGNSEDYRDLKSIINEKEDEFGVPFFVCLGNHDDREAFWAGYKNEANRNSEYYYSVMVPGLRLIFLDSKQGTDEGGFISEEQLNWLNNELKNFPQETTLIVVHHPLLCRPLDFMAYSVLQNTNELLRVIEGSDVRAILSGHIHFNSVVNISGILNTVIAASAYGIDCSNPRLHRFIDDSSYGVVRVADGQVMVQQLALPASNGVKFELPINHQKLQAHRLFDESAGD